MKKIIKILIILAVVIIIAIVGCKIILKDNRELISISSEKQLEKIYDGDENSDLNDFFKNVISMPFSFFGEFGSRSYYEHSSVINDAIDIAPSSKFSSSSSSIFSSSSSTKNDYSTTNIQVENVDEADITKTDGNYIYSISENEVIITNVTIPEKINIDARITIGSDCIPVDLILNENKLVVIAENSSGSSSIYYKSNNTIVKIYDITDRTSPKILKSFELNQNYYTSRCIGNKLYIISSGNLRKENNKIDRSYKEDFITKELELKNIKYLKDVKTIKQTIIAFTDLDSPKDDIKLNSYLMDVSNAYVSEKSIYLLDEEYNYNGGCPSVSSLWGLAGIFGAFNEDNYDYDYGYKTQIFKFDIKEDGDVVYNSKTKTNGKTINQYSLDEKDGHLRIAVSDSDGSRILIFDEKLKEIGSTANIAKGEKMYSTRFMGNKVYLVTYKTIDPLFVIDLSDETNPRILGELSIPGYSTYLHPYDETHIIGIGMETKEIVNKDYFGRVTSTTAKIVGMKMALFDVSDVSNPIQISQTIIGDSRTTSAILTNPKALLFSKEKGIIAIPVNNYSEDFEISSSDNYSTVINSYTNYSGKRNSEGYFVYSINVKDGINLKGTITHEEKELNNYYYNRYESKLLRGLYINDKLYTVSETAIKVNNLEDLKLINELKINDEEEIVETGFNFNIFE